MVASAEVRKSTYKGETYEMVSRWTADTLIRYKRDAKTPGSKSLVRYQKYQDSKTVGEALANGSFPYDLLFDYEKGLLQVVGGPIRDEPLDMSQVTDESELTETDRVLVKWYRRELAKKLGLDYRDLFVQSGSESTFMRGHRLVAQREARRILEETRAEGRRVSDADVHAVLKAWAFAKNGNRSNVMPEGQSWVFSDTWGLLMDRIGDVHVTKPTKDYQEVVQVACQWLRDRLPADLEEPFSFTSINVNCNYAAKIHRDGNNHGPSMIAAFGTFTGGELNYWPEDDKTQDLEKFEMKDSVKLDLKQGLALFNGNCAHSVNAFEGQRYSIVFFTVRDKIVAKSTAEDREFLRDLGVNFPEPTQIPDKYTLLRPPAGLGKAPKGKPGKPSWRYWPGEHLEAQAFTPERPRKAVTPASPSKASKRRAGDDAAEVATPAKRGRGAEAKDGQVLRETVIQEAAALGYTLALQNLAGRPEAKDCSYRVLLDALKASGGLVNKAKAALSAAPR